MVLFILATQYLHDNKACQDASCKSHVVEPFTL